MKVRPVGVIGLGGTGKLAALHVKRGLRDRFGIDAFPATQVLVIDTDPGMPPGQPIVAMDGTRITLVTGGSRGELVTLDTADLRLIQEEAAKGGPMYDWLDEWWPGPRLDQPVYTPIGMGAKMIGAFGRLAFLVACQHHDDDKNPKAALGKFINDIVSIKLNRLCQSALEKSGYDGDSIEIDFSVKPMIYIVASLCGGTGRGCFLDTAMLLRTLGYAGDVVGIFLTSPVFESLSAIRKNGQEPKIRANNVAALCELEAFQAQIDEISRCAVRAGSNQGEELTPGSGPLFDYVHLMSDTTEEGKVLGHGDGRTAEAAQGVAEFILALQYDLSDAYQASASNLAAGMKVYREGGSYIDQRFRARYGSFGFYRAAFPPLDVVAELISLRRILQTFDAALNRRRPLSGWTCDWTQEWEQKVTAEIPESVDRLAGHLDREYNRLLNTRYANKASMVEHLTEIGSLDRDLNERGSYSSLSDDLHATLFSEVQHEIDALRERIDSLDGLKEAATALEGILSRLQEQDKELSDFRSQLKKHIEEEEKRRARQIASAKDGDVAGRDLGIRELWRQRANRTKELFGGSKYWFDLDADQYLEEVFSCHFGSRNKPFSFTGSTGATLVLATPGWSEYHFAGQLTSYLSRLMTDVEQLLDRARQIGAAIAQVVQKAEKRLTELRRATAPSLGPYGGTLLPASVLADLDGKVTDLPPLGAEMLSSKIEGGALEINALLEEVKAEVKAAVGDQYKTMDILPHLESVGIRDAASLEKQASEWMQWTTHHGEGIRQTGFFGIASSARSDDQDSRVTYVPGSDIPFAEALTARFGRFASCVENLTRWVRSMDRHHEAWIDRRLKKYWQNHDITDGRLIICRWCGADNTDALKGVRDKTGAVCTHCHRRIDGTWVCEGTPAERHPRAVYDMGQIVCELCSNKRPGYQRPPYCIGCLISAGLPLDTPQADVPEVAPQAETCPHGHRVRIVCPNCLQDDMLKKIEINNKADGKQYDLYRCDRDICRKLNGGRAWWPCPVCGYPVAPPKPGEQITTCLRCTSQLKPCEECPPGNPFRLRIVADDGTVGECPSKQLHAAP